MQGSQLYVMRAVEKISCILSIAESRAHREVRNLNGEETIIALLWDALLLRSTRLVLQ